MDKKRIFQEFQTDIKGLKRIIKNMEKDIQKKTKSADRDKAQWERLRRSKEAAERELEALRQQAGVIFPFFFKGSRL